MSRLRFQVSVSLDGFSAGPNQSVENPLGEGGMQLHEWVFGLAAWRAPHGLEGGEVNASHRGRRGSAREHRRDRDGAEHVRRPRVVGGQPLGRLVGRRPALPHAGVRRHPSRPERRWRMQGGTTFTFVTDGIESALEQARAAAGGQGRRPGRRRERRPAIPARRGCSTSCSSTSCRFSSAAGRGCSTTSRAWGAGSSARASSRLPASPISPTGCRRRHRARARARGRGRRCSLGDEELLEP